ncbi:MAG: ATP-binding protein [Eubacteriales bacterium]
MKQLLILSGKGGTGKTTVAVAFISLTRAKAYADCDVDAPNLHLINRQEGEANKTDFYALPKAVIDEEKCVGCGICQANCRFGAVSRSDNHYRLDTFSCEGCGVCARTCYTGAIRMEPAVSGELMLYTANAVFSTAKLRMGSGSSGKLVNEVKKGLFAAQSFADIAVVDGSPGIGCPVIASMSGAEMVLIVAEPTVSGISDMKRILKTARIFGTKTAVCVNKYDVNADNSDEIESFCRDEGIPFAGRIPFDKMAVKAVNSGVSLDKIPCPAGEAVREVYNNTMRILLEDTAG